MKKADYEEIYRIIKDKHSEEWDNDNQVKNKALGLLTILGIIVAVGSTFEMNISRGGNLDFIIFLLSQALLGISLFYCIRILISKKFENFDITLEDVYKVKSRNELYKNLNKKIDDARKAVAKVHEANQKLFHIATYLTYFGSLLILIVNLNKFLKSDSFLYFGTILIVMGFTYIKVMHNKVYHGRN